MARNEFRGDETIHVFEQEALVAGPLLQDAGFGLEAKLNSLVGIHTFAGFLQSKWLVVATIGLVVIWRHDAEALWLFMGSVLNGVLSNVLKQVLNQDHPVSALKSDPGMPSSHSMSMFFAATFGIVSMIQWGGVTALTLVPSAIVFAIASYLSWLRVPQQFHTISQVLVGAVLGSAFSVVSFWLWDAVVLEAYISHIWVQVCIAVGGTGFLIAFVAYAISHWLKDDS